MAIRTLPIHPCLVLCVVFLLTCHLGGAQDSEEPAVDANPPTSPTRSFTEIEPEQEAPSVRAIAPLDDTNVFFLNKRGQIGVAKFSPGLSLIAWEYYSEIKLNALPSLAIGPEYSVITASPTELTQAFDTNQDVELDFFQTLVREWAGRDLDVEITAGPVADRNGRILFALSPFSPNGESPPKAHIMAWHPAAEGLVALTESQLPISAFAVSSSGLLAARLSMPEYGDGYFVSLTELAKFDPTALDSAPSPMPFTRPSLLIPAELTRNADPTELCFFNEGGVEKILLTCPEKNQIVEIVPEKVGSTWQGSILLRQISESPITALSEVRPGFLLGGSDSGFTPVGANTDKFRISSIGTRKDGVILGFTKPVSRPDAVSSESFSVEEISLQGGKKEVTALPIIESDGRSILLKLEKISPKTVLRIVCENVPSETGERLLSTAAFYTVHER